jgi:hypothetical protein
MSARGTIGIAVGIACASAAHADPVDDLDCATAMLEAIDPFLTTADDAPPRTRNPPELLHVAMAPTIRQGAVVRPYDGKPVTRAALNTPSVRYGAPRGYGQFIVKAVNKRGYAVGTATCTACSTGVARAFVYIPGSGFTGLSGHVSNLAYADDAFAIDDDNQIAIHGELDAAGSAPTYYLVAL